MERLITKEKKRKLTKLFAVGAKVRGGDRSFVALKQVQTSNVRGSERSAVPASARRPGNGRIGGGLWGSGSAPTEHARPLRTGVNAEHRPPRRAGGSPLARPRSGRPPEATCAERLRCTFRGPPAGSRPQVRGAARASELFPGDSDAGAPRKPSENSGGPWGRRGGRSSGRSSRAPPGLGAPGGSGARHESRAPQAEGRAARGSGLGGGLLSPCPARRGCSRDPAPQPAGPAPGRRTAARPYRGGGHGGAFGSRLPPAAGTGRSEGAGEAGGPCGARNRPLRAAAPPGHYNNGAPVKPRAPGVASRAPRLRPRREKRDLGHLASRTPRDRVSPHTKANVC
ncbi:translation initiation factor IF-2-like [Moschus berezovskii]|uniref:translation initiation factor IF-2-like n=1 Tax=Moschus berezovskii TaxID=68408 RepID=UPI002443BEBD|nr:translation initiation factor IF-2-like [Moschus berezovskii]